MSLDEKAKAAEISPVSTNTDGYTTPTPTPAPNTNTLDNEPNTPSLTTLENLQVLPKILREGILFIASAPALLLQAAHPALNSSSPGNLQRDLPTTLNSTLSYIAALVFGTREEKTALLGRLRLAQPPFLTPSTSGNQEAQLWVLATLYATATHVYQRVYGTFDFRTSEASYVEFGLVLMHLSPTLLAPGAWPSSRAKFWSYFDKIIANLTVSAAAQDFAASLPNRDDLPRSMSLTKPVLRAVTIEMLPENVRSGYRLQSTVGSRTMYSTAMGLVKPVYPVLPGGWKRGHVEFYLGEVRRIINA
ncbi:oxygenase MpaB family protein [Aspergillus stella-maris]|uniref:oxygenase MpaB family protein n=1 Tax=Aspergillus stella-maris TaxID=1810926 RepID=UPI003CCCCAF0